MIWAWGQRCLELSQESTEHATSLHRESMSLLFWNIAEISIIAIFIIERVGRRPLMLWCALGMGVTMVLLAGLYIETSDNGNSAAQAVSVLCLFIFNCFL